jgi:hypothetical protein
MRANETGCEEGRTMGIVRLDMLPESWGVSGPSNVASWTRARTSRPNQGEI